MVSIESTVSVQFKWTIDIDEIIRLGFGQSNCFGSENALTKFYLRAKKESNLSLCLYLAFCEYEKLHVNCNLKCINLATNALVYNLNKSKDISLDKTCNICWTGLGYFRYRFECKIIYQNVPNKPVLKPMNHLQPLCDNLAALRLDPILSDVTLFTTIDSKEFPVHKVILSMRSSVFAAMFKHENVAENQKNRVEIIDISGEVMAVLLDYIYFGDVTKVDAVSSELLEAADKYDIQPLVQACIQSMYLNISIENAAKMYYLADLHQLEELKLKAIEFIGKNKEAIKRTCGWTEFIKTNAGLLEQLFDKLV